MSEKNSDSIDQLDPRRFILIKGARANNLKNVSVAIPRNQLIAVSGLSGSGKSSLIFDTLFAEGQRMYVESLNSYARQFLGRMEKPEVDYIRGVSPAIAIEQKVNTRNPRSTVGTTTEIYDYLKLLFARAGKTYSPESGRQVQKDQVSDVVTFVLGEKEGSKYMVLAPMQPVQGRKADMELNLLLQKGFNRIQTEDGSVTEIEDCLLDTAGLKKINIAKCRILIDRAAVSKDDEAQARLSDSISTAFFEGGGEAIIHFLEGETRHFSDRFEEDGILFEEPSVNFFTFNNPYGACKRCEGFGSVLGIDEDLVFPDRSMSVFEGAVAPWKGEKMQEWQKPLLKNGIKFDFPVHRPIAELSQAEYRLLWEGNAHFKGLDDFFRYLESHTHKIQYRVLLSRYRGRTACPECKGTRLRKDAAYVRVHDKTINDIVLASVSDIAQFFKTLEPSEAETQLAGRIYKEIQSRLDFLVRVGLGYLTLNRLTSTLSGGEYQRIKLATSLGSSLVGSMYILDEPSIGLHPRDTARLITVLKELRNQGNTVIVVEHEEEILRAADQLIDIGPNAGAHGGELVFQGKVEDMVKGSKSWTARYMLGEAAIPQPAFRRKWTDAITIVGAREHNLKNVTVAFPLHCLVAVSGVSGSGKSTLVKKILFPALTRAMGGIQEESGKYDRLEGPVSSIGQIEFVDQNPIGRSSRSNPVTYIKAFDAIRQLFSEQPLAQQRGYKPGYFSFNVEGGRCETCQGDGMVTVEMQFMADLRFTCETCKGKRYQSEVQEVLYQGKSISDVLDLTIDEALIFFKEKPRIADKLRPLQDVGLGYIHLGQPSSSLSGGEAQRVKLAYYLGAGNEVAKHVLFLFDEPTTGLHMHDVAKLLDALNALIQKGHSVLVIEHNLDVLKSSDWIIDLGPEGGESGGYVTFAGTPEDLVNAGETSLTAKYMAARLPIAKATKK
jgi:excinuclease ABC subunit A